MFTHIRWISDIYETCTVCGGGDGGLGGCCIMDFVGMGDVICNR